MNTKSLSCVVTGADVFLPEHNAIAHGDLFKIGDTWLLNTRGCEEWRYRKQGEKIVVNITFRRMDRVGGGPVLVCHEDNANDANHSGWIVQ